MQEPEGCEGVLCLWLFLMSLLRGLLLRPSGLTVPFALHWEGLGVSVCLQGAEEAASTFRAELPPCP